VRGEKWYMAEGVLWKHNRGRDCKGERGGGKHVMLITTQEVTVLSVVEVGKVLERIISPKTCQLTSSPSSLSSRSERLLIPLYSAGNSAGNDRQQATGGNSNRQQATGGNSSRQQARQSDIK
jgi:hypothetical protein